MAPTERYTPIPASLWAEGSWFIERSSRAQLLYFQLWTSDDRDAAGFVPLQPEAWAERSATSTLDTVALALTELVDLGDVLVDKRAGKVWLRRFIEQDAYNSPNVFVSAMKRIRTCPSRTLRIAAWHEIERLGLPVPKSDKPETRDKMLRRMEAAYGPLRDQMAVDGDEVSSAAGVTPASPPTKTPTYVSFERVSKPFGDGSERVSSDETEDHTGGVLLCANGCDEVAGPDGYCDSCVKAQKW